MKKLNPITIVHLILMALLSLGTIGAAVKFLISFLRSTGTASIESASGLSDLSNVILMGFILSMLIMGILYLLKGYNKQAAAFYKAFLILHIGVCVLTIFIDLCFYRVDVLMIGISILNACKIIALAILAFGKDLGKQKTWTLFYILLVLDAVKLILAVINMVNIGFDFSFTGYVTALIADGTIGLAVKGKYDDKETRGKA